MKFVFESKIYKIGIWVLILFVLLTDFVTIFVLFQVKQMSIFLGVIGILGIVLKGSILICLLKQKGPIIGLLYVWGGLMILSGVAGLLGYLISPISISASAYFMKLLILVQGLIIVIPAKKFIKYVSEPVDTISEA